MSCTTRLILILLALSSAQRNAASPCSKRGVWRDRLMESNFGSVLHVINGWKHLVIIDEKTHGTELEHSVKSAILKALCVPETKTFTENLIESLPPNCGRLTPKDSERKNGAVRDSEVQKNRPAQFSMRLSDQDSSNVRPFVPSVDHPRGLQDIMRIILSPSTWNGYVSFVTQKDTGSRTLSDRAMRPLLRVLPAACLLWLLWRCEPIMAVLAALVPGLWRAYCKTLEWTQ